MELQDGKQTGTVRRHVSRGNQPFLRQAPLRWHQTHLWYVLPRAPSSPWKTTRKTGNTSDRVCLKLIIHHTAEKKRWEGKRFPPYSPHPFTSSPLHIRHPSTFPDLPNVSVAPDDSFLPFLLFFLTKVEFFQWNAEKKREKRLTFQRIWAIIRKSGKFSTLAGLNDLAIRLRSTQSSLGKFRHGRKLPFN